MNRDVDIGEEGLDAWVRATRGVSDAVKSVWREDSSVEDVLCGNNLLVLRKRREYW